MNWHFSSVAGAAYKKPQHAVVKELYTALAHLSNMQDAKIAAAMTRLQHAWMLLWQGLRTWLTVDGVSRLRHRRLLARPSRVYEGQHREPLAACGPCPAHEKIHVSPYRQGILCLTDEGMGQGVSARFSRVDEGQRHRQYVTPSCPCLAHERLSISLH